ncbi:cystathionine gamma-synthase 1, chloroplastic [Selaginella moellendorffii]|uniref:cystathionine gamma-synthase 1, chloroplastic n=1 Tax=Selaginella moellendorffii TaxID=88036 RepID=UPI000D1C982B|nr:cystathionine gamma-synthase 1, chloroplastic [Selaginella moellendorffii]|eukprot:XP_024526047.1 cystathionine gamma-synthase 1, chloroplastic [Selaginella moellendorffii]
MAAAASFPFYCGCDYRADSSGAASPSPAPAPISPPRSGTDRLSSIASAAMILRFPPNFARQLSVKSRRNCSNIGVAQVVAASAMSGQSSGGSSSIVDGVAAALSVGISVNGTAVKIDKAAEKPKPKSTSTLAVHGGERENGTKVADSLTTPIVQTATYTFRNTADLIAFQDGTYKSFEYGRYGNPTTQATERKISALEGAEETLVSASGMCAATTMLLALVPAGGHIVTTTDCYRRTRQFVQTVLPKMGITTTVIDPADMASLKRALDDNPVSLFFSESPTNPYLRCIDIELVSTLCRRKGAIVCIDGTFATPVNQKALALGADLVLNSATKYIAGHNDVLAGSISGSKPLVDTVRKLHNVLGGVVDAHAAYLIGRGLKTLDLRVRQQNSNALRLARALESHPKIARVHYPGLESHPEFHIASKQMRGFGGVVSFEIDGDLALTSKFIDGLRIPYIAPSLGGCESLVEQPTIISYWDQSPAERAKMGIKDNLVRFSCGIEDYEDIYADVMQSLASL